MADDKWATYRGLFDVVMVWDGLDERERENVRHESPKLAEILDLSSAYMLDGRFMSLQWVYVPVEPISQVAKMCHRFVTTKKRT